MAVVFKQCRSKQRHMSKGETEMPYSPVIKPLISLIFMQMLVILAGTRGAAAVDETIPHPIDERGLLSQIAVNTTRLFRTVEIIELRDASLARPRLATPCRDTGWKE